MYCTYLPTIIIKRKIISTEGNWGQTNIQAPDEADLSTGKGPDSIRQGHRDSAVVRLPISLLPND